MDEILNELNIAFQAISSISVAGEAVDAMALARAKLRNVHSKLKEYDVNKIVEEDDSVKMEN